MSETEPTPTGRTAQIISACRSDAAACPACLGCLDARYIDWHSVNQWSLWCDDCWLDWLASPGMRQSIYCGFQYISDMTEADYAAMLIAGRAAAERWV